MCPPAAQNKDRRSGSEKLQSSGEQKTPEQMQLVVLSFEMVTGDPFSGQCFDFAVGRVAGVNLT
jgi:hypothetical protein